MEENQVWGNTEIRIYQCLILGSSQINFKKTKHIATRIPWTTIEINFTTWTKTIMAYTFRMVSSHVTSASTTNSLEVLGTKPIGTQIQLQKSVAFVHNKFVHMTKCLSLIICQLRSFKLTNKFQSRLPRCPIVLISCLLSVGCCKFSIVCCLFAVLVLGNSFRLSKIDSI